MEVQPRPSVAGIEHDAQQITHLLRLAIADLAFVFSFRMVKRHIGLRRYGMLEMQASPRRRDVFQGRDFHPRDAALFSPADHEQGCAQVTFSFAPMMLHPFLIGNSARNFRPSCICNIIALRHRGTYEASAAQDYVVTL